MGPESLRVDRIAGHSFLAAPLTASATVVDLGVNRGEFATAMIARYGCRVVGVEPVPELFTALPAIGRLSVENLALTRDGEPTSLYLNQSSCATIEHSLSQDKAPTVEVAGTTLAGLLDRYRLERVPLVKVDIEGTEIALFDSSTIATLQRVDQFTVEFHDWLDPTMVEPVQHVKRRLRSAGFAELSLTRDNSDVLFINLARIRFTALRRATVAVVHKYPQGVRRFAARKLRARAR